MNYLDYLRSKPRRRHLAAVKLPCPTCGGTGRYLWTRPAAGGEVVDRYGDCPDCKPKP